MSEPEDFYEYDPYDRSHECEHCGEELQWEECTDCEDGYYDAYEEDPLWYDPGDMKPCHTCEGKAGWYVCWNYKNHKEKS